MAGPDNTYPNSKVGLLRGAQKIFVDSDGYFRAANTDYTGQQLKNVLDSRTGGVIIINSAGVLSDQGDGSYPTILPSGNGVIFFSLADAASNASARLFSARDGNVLELMTRGGGSTCSIVIYCEDHTSGVDSAEVIGLLSGAISSIDMHGSAGSQAYVKLVSTSDGTWSVVDYRGQVTFNAAA